MSERGATRRNNNDEIIKMNVSYFTNEIKVRDKNLTNGRIINPHH